MKDEKFYSGMNKIKLIMGSLMLLGGLVLVILCVLFDPKGVIDYSIHTMYAEISIVGLALFGLEVKSIKEFFNLDNGNNSKKEI